MVNAALTSWSMKRSLVLTNEAARHPFRRLLPPETLTPMVMEPSMGDMKFFMLSFTAAFLAFYGFLS
jgi:hypothetical protein